MISSQIKPHYKIAHSPDTDDVFMFWALQNKKIPHPRFDISLFRDDIETLNKQSYEEIYDVTALSFMTAIKNNRLYQLTQSGSSFADKDYGPLVVSHEKSIDLSQKRIAIPGFGTTAGFLAKINWPDADFVEIPFHEILSAVQSKKVDAGVLIHESQIFYRETELFCQEHLINVWRRFAPDLPLPLGGSAVKRSLPDSVRHELASLQTHSIEYAQLNFESVRDAILKERGHDMTPEEANTYLSWYANETTKNMGVKGNEALQILADLAYEYKMIPERFTMDCIEEAS